jgi:uncharacterized protein
VTAPAANFLDILKAEAEAAEAAESDLRREFAQRIKLMEQDRAFCFRRLNLMRAVAAAMDHQVDVLCTATAGKLMLKGWPKISTSSRATQRPSMTGSRKPMSREHASGACPANLDLFGKGEGDLIPECQGLMGAAAMIQDVMDGECRVLTF